MFRVARFPQELVVSSVLKARRSAVSQNGFRKRCVSVASCSVELRSAAYQSPNTPLSVLKGAFDKSRRAASTEKLSVLSGRLASTSVKSPSDSNRGTWRMASNLKLREREWRQLSSVVANVLRNVRKAAGEAQALEASAARVPRSVN